MQLNLSSGVWAVLCAIHDREFVCRNLDLEVVHEPELSLVAKIECLTNDVPAPESRGLYAKCVRKMGGQVRFRFLNRKPQIRHANGHGDILLGGKRPMWLAALS